MARSNALSQALRHVSLTFDAEQRLHLWEPAAAQHTEQLLQTSNNFQSQLQEFNTTSQELLSVLSHHSKLVEQQRLLALSLSAQLEDESVQRADKQHQLEVELKRKQAELLGMEEEWQNLHRVEQEQKLMTERLQKM